MDFVEAIKSFYGRYFDFATRSSRSEYWWVQLFNFILVIVLIVPMFMMFGVSGGDPSGSAMFMAFAPVGLFLLINIIPGIAVTVRRFHDQDKSGWFYLLSFIPYVGGIVVIVFMCLRGTSGPNRFGEDPLQPIGDIFN